MVEPKSEPLEEENHQNKNLWGINNLTSSLMRKRSYDQTNGIDGKQNLVNATDVVREVVGPQPSAKRRQLAPPGLLATKATQELYGFPRGNPMNGRAKVATITRVGGRKQMISWVDAPDDVFFVATDGTR